MSSKMRITKIWNMKIKIKHSVNWHENVKMKEKNPYPITYLFFLNILEWNDVVMFLWDSPMYSQYLKYNTAIVARRACGSKIHSELSPVLQMGIYWLPPGGTGNGLSYGAFCWRLTLLTQIMLHVVLCLILLSYSSHTCGHDQKTLVLDDRTSESLKSDKNKMYQTSQFDFPLVAWELIIKSHWPLIFIYWIWIPR